MLYQVEVVITLKKGIRDPEAETIYRHLILRKGFNSIKSVRAGKYLLFSVDAESPEKALEVVRTICERLRIHNPVIHDIEVKIIG